MWLLEQPSLLCVAEVCETTYPHTAIVGTCAPDRVTSICHILMSQWKCHLCHEVRHASDGCRRTRCSRWCHRREAARHVRRGHPGWMRWRGVDPPGGRRIVPAAASAPRSRPTPNSSARTFCGLHTSNTNIFYEKVYLRTSHAG